MITYKPNQMATKQESQTYFPSGENANLTIPSA